MKNTKLELAETNKQLFQALLFIQASMPLALKELGRGDVSLSDQQFFWEARTPLTDWFNLPPDGDFTDLVSFREEVEKDYYKYAPKSMGSIDS